MAHKRNENRLKWRKEFNAMHPLGHKEFSKFKKAKREEVKAEKLKWKLERRKNE